MNIEAALGRLHVLRTELETRADQETVGAAIEQLEAMKSLTDNVLAMLVTKREWNVPLSDGVRAEVRIYGDPTIAHVKAFAKLFGYIAECYSAPERRAPATAPATSPQTSPDATASADSIEGEGR